MPKSVPLSSAQELLIAPSVAAGDALLLDREDRLATLRAAWQEGVESGGYVPLDIALDGLVEVWAVRATTCP